MLLAIGRMVAEKSMIAWPLQSIFFLSILYSRDINNHETPPGPRDKIPRSISSEYTQITFLLLYDRFNSSRIRGAELFGPNNVWFFKIWKINKMNEAPQTTELILFIHLCHFEATENYGKWQLIWLFSDKRCMKAGCV